MFRNWENDAALLPGLKYEYTELDRVRKSCSMKKAVRMEGMQYPDGHSYDKRFDMSSDAGYETIAKADKRTNDPLNISYKLSFNPSSVAKLGGWFSPLNLSMSPQGQVEITAEGLYDDETGHLCMLGCRKLSSSTQESRKNSFRLRFL
ncbi:unnamed protein product [Fraxinus pennsylvanica]|uniref:DUF2921 domain-containing protein n=1 Tax=Fraxinus pennsylvanica TaxID=56036 RepID=A0AAD2E9V9_9LAMI|nr:unnamed protein product [Fraxinus pennsylvanica]